MRAAAVLGALVMLAGACGSDDDGDEAAADNAPTPETAAAASGDAEWDAVVEAAKEEGKVVLYLALAGYEEQFEKGFEAAYPEIDLEILREGTGALTTKLDQERATNADGGDVTLHSSRAWMEENKQYFTPPTSPNVELWQDSDQFYDSYFTALLVPFTPGFNPGVIESVGADPIQDWEDLLQPELKGLIGLVRPDVSPVYMQHFWFLNESIGSDFIDQLAAQEPRLYDSAGPLSQAVAAGELAAGINITPPQVGGLADEGAPIESASKVDPPYTIGYWAAQMSWSKRPNAAAVLMDYMLSEEGQAAMSDWGYSASPLPQVTGDYELPERIEVFDGIMTPDQEAFAERFNDLIL